MKTETGTEFSPPKNVKLGEGARIEEFVVLGKLPAAAAKGSGGQQNPGSPLLEIGANCHLRSGTVIYAGTKIGDNFQTGHGAMVREGCTIGNNVSVGTNSVVERDTVIKDGVRIHSGAFIPEYTLLEEGAWIGPNVVLTNALHPSSPQAKEHMKGPTIGKNAKVGANSTILPFVCIGQNALVGAGSVVVDDVERNAVVVGNPARKIKTTQELLLPGGAGPAYPTGEKMAAGTIHRSLPYLDGAERRAVLEVLASGRFVKGGRAKELESAFASYCGAKYAVALNSGTSALFLSLLAFGVQGKEVITVSNSFLATANAIELAGAKAVFAEPDEKTFNISPEKIEEKITPKTAGIIPVHLYGQACDMEEIMRIAKKRNLFVLEDACQAHGTRHNGRRVGGLGDAACFSFYPTKNVMCAGDGGIVTTSNGQIARKIMMLRDAGRDGTSADDCKIFGFNCRMSEMQAAVALQQLKRLDSWNARRREIAAIYDRELSGLVETPYVPGYSHHIYHLYTIKAKRRDELLGFLKKKGMESSISYSIPLPLTTAFSGKYGYKRGDFPASERLSSGILSLPMFPGLSDEEAMAVCGAIKEFFSGRA